MDGVSDVSCAEGARSERREMDNVSDVSCVEGVRSGGRWTTLVT